MFLAQAELLFVNEDFKKLITSGNQFDLIIIVLAFNEAHYILSEIFVALIIVSASAGPAFYSNYFIGNSEPYSYVPMLSLPITDNMSFLERLLNTLVNVIGKGIINLKRHEQQAILNKYFDNPPDLESYFKNVALIFSNGHFSFITNRPSVPNVIDVGGYHVEKVKELPNDLKVFLDNAKEDFIYFSLGSNMRSEFLKPELQAGILEAFSKLNMKVLWKFETELENIPENVNISKWLSQNDILAHPNIKIFITHGGLLSTIEAVHHGVPMIGIPMFADQLTNIPVQVEAGFALQIKYSELSGDILYEKINEILLDPKFNKNAKLRSDLLTNQPISPMDQAIYWVEHVIKHKGAEHLKNASINLYWFQNLLLDVILLISIIILITIYLVKVLFKVLYNLIRRKSLKSKSD